MKVSNRISISIFQSIFLTYLFHPKKSHCAALRGRFDSWVYEITLFAPGILLRNTLRSLRHIT